jgi:hypothetical protein
MGQSHLLSGLIAKRAELAGKIEYTNTQLRQLMLDLDALDKTILLFEPDIDLEEIRPKPMPPRHSAFQGQVSRMVLDILRKEGQPMGVADLTARIMASRGLNTSDARLVRLMQKRLGASLRNLRTRGTVQSKPGGGGRLVWEPGR